MSIKSVTTAMALTAILWSATSAYSEANDFLFHDVLLMMLSDYLSIELTPQDLSFHDTVENEKVWISTARVKGKYQLAIVIENRYNAVFIDSDRGRVLFYEDASPPPWDTALSDKTWIYSYMICRSARLAKDR